MCLRSMLSTEVGIIFGCITSRVMNDTRDCNGRPVPIVQMPELLLCRIFFTSSSLKK